MQPATATLQDRVSADLERLREGLSHAEAVVKAYRSAIAALEGTPLSESGALPQPPQGKYAGLQAWKAVRAYLTEKGDWCSVAEVAEAVIKGKAKIGKKHPETQVWKSIQYHALQAEEKKKVFTLRGDLGEAVLDDHELRSQLLVGLKSWENR